MEENKFKNGKSDDGSKKQGDLLSSFFVLMCMLCIILLLSILVWTILFSLSIYIEAFLQVFIDFYTRVVLQHLGTMFVMIAIGAFVYIVEAYCSLTSKKYEKNNEGSQKSYFKSYFLSFYITFLVLMPLVIHLILHTSGSVAFICVILVFFVFVLLKLCLNHPVLDLLSLIWSGIALIGVLFLQPTLVIVVIGTLGLIIMVGCFIQNLRKRKEINLNTIIKAIKELVKKGRLLSLVYSSIKKLMTKIDPLLYGPECQQVNKIYLLVILTLTLFTIGTIFIADFTRAEEYYAISQNIELCVYGHPCVPYHNNISSICSLHHKNIKDNLTFIKTKRGNYSALYPVDTFCTQYDQHRKDFITYFSTLIVATITFFVMMYEKFIRRKEKKRRHRKKMKNKR